MKKTMFFYFYALSLSIFSNMVNAEESSLQNKTNELPVSIHYQISNKNASADWYMLREKNHVVTYNQANQQGEIWSRATNGDIEHDRFFGEDKMTIVYTMGELRALGKVPDWNQLLTIISADKVAQLTKVSETKFMGTRAEVREGTIDGVKTKVWWLPEYNIPGKLEEVIDNQTKTMEIKELFKNRPASWNWADEASLKDYGMIDASDFGDMEYDPFVKKVLAQDGHQHHH